MTQWKIYLVSIGGSSMTNLVDCFSTTAIGRIFAGRAIIFSKNSTENGGTDEHYIQVLRSSSIDNDEIPLN
jgi:hypothetical protein